ncbi:PID-CTERM protein-sorting domain-containing protein [Formosa haliotis]|uniref:PID-CTERM protein-sorting domain-containing protein n=1 Tax=Formosa haliotis TaxID=1555194 RepID=UPI000825B501|nr:hypothetical protein [Formosa haliotis]
MRKITKLIVVFILVSSSAVCFAQVGKDNGPPVPSTVEGTPPPGLPIDGGLTFLIAAGAYYGIKKSIRK